MTKKQETAGEIHPISHSQSRPRVARTRRGILTAAVATVALALAACSTGAGDGEERECCKNRPTVLTTFTVLADMAQNVAGDHLVVESITTPDAEIHEYQPTPADLKRAEGASLILNNGLGLEKWFERFVDSAGVKSVEVSAGVEPIAIADGDAKGQPNPHAWMSPSDATIYVDNIAKAFAELDPDHAQDYQSNAAAYKAKITEIGTQMKTQLATIPENQRVLVSCEGAFSYLTRDAGMTEKYLWAVNSDGGMTPQRVADVESYVKDNKVPAVFCESTVGDKMKPIVESTGAKFGGVLYVDSLTNEGGDAPTYLDLLSYDTKLITDHLTGAAK